jgi:2-keto-4-pentenoate hydratase/2-oxohepta-3-ene-1,7-dioic acid hydratase in catechol pathway
MRLARIGAAGAERPAAWDGAQWRDLSSVIRDVDGALLSTGLDEVRALVVADRLPVLDVEGTRFGAPLTGIGKIVCIGLNYRDHAEETGAAEPSEPVVFMKAPDTVVGPTDDVLIPRGSVKTDWEVELGVVIGEPARYLASPADSLAHVAGYVLSHDVSEREFQIERGGQWDKGKNCETFSPLGPWLVTADEIADPQALSLRLWVNGRSRQDGNTKNMIFDVAHVVWYLSQFMVLRPGDVINTGTPAGVALGLPEHPYLVAGDVVELEIDQLGRQRQTFRQA